MKRVCIVGYGAIGPIHAKALETVENAELYAVCDILPERAEAAGVKAYTDFDLMLLCSEIDCVHICTPHHLHFEMIKKALASGKEVICEKPVTMTEDDFSQLLNLENSDKVCVVLQNRLNPCIQKLTETVGSLGRIISVKGILTWHRSADYYSHDSWRGKWATEGGGVLINQAVHTLDLLSYIAGDIKSVKAQMTNFSLDQIEVEDTFSAHLDFGDFTGMFFATNAYGTSSAPQIEIVCENGTLVYRDYKLFLDGNLIEQDSTVCHGKTYWGGGHTTLFKNYYDEGRFFSPHDIKNTMHTMFSMYESAKCNCKKIRIKE